MSAKKAKRGRKKQLKVAGAVAGAAYLDVAYQLHKGIQPYVNPLPWGTALAWPGQISAIKAAVVAGAGSIPPNPGVTMLQLGRMLLTGNSAAVAPAGS